VAASRRPAERRNVPAETHVEQGPLDRQQVLDLIRDRLASFADDLEADSLALIELVEALEEELGERSVGFRIEDEDLNDLKTVRDAVDYVMSKLGG
jgi:acyl carrier protein